MVWESQAESTSSMSPRIQEMTSIPLSHKACRDSSLMAPQNKKFTPQEQNREARPKGSLDGREICPAG